MTVNVMNLGKGVIDSLRVDGNDEEAGTVMLMLGRVAIVATVIVLVVKCMSTQREIIGSLAMNDIGATV